MSKAGGDDLTGAIIWPILEARYVFTLSKAKIHQESKYTLSTIKDDPLKPIITTTKKTTEFTIFKMQSKSLSPEGTLRKQSPMGSI